MSTFKILEDQVDSVGNIIPIELPKFTVIGVGGGGGNAVEHMVRTGINGINFVCANTDNQALNTMSAPVRILLGSKTTRGLGAGADPEVGRNAALEDKERILEAIKGSDMVFVTAGMGGGTGTGAAPVIAKIAKDAGMLVVGVVTLPFAYEQRKRYRIAAKGVTELNESVDSLIVIDNQKLISVYGDLPFEEGFKKANDVLLTSVRSIFDLIINAGHINLDFADLRAVMSNRGYAMMGVGSASGEGRAQLATKAAIHSKLLDNVRLKDAKGVLINIGAGNNVTGNEIDEIMNMAGQLADIEGEIIFGTVFDADLGDEIRVTIIATGLERLEGQESNPPTAPTAATVVNAIPATVATQPLDLPAIDRRGSEVLGAPQAAQPAPLAAKTSADGIKEFLQLQQKKSD